MEMVKPTCLLPFCPAPISRRSHSSLFGSPCPFPSTLPHARRPLFLDHTTCSIDGSRIQNHFLQLKPHKRGDEKLGGSLLSTATRQTSAHNLRKRRRTWGKGLGEIVRASESSTSFGQQKHTTDHRESESIGKHNSARPEGLREQTICRGSHQRS